MIKSIPKGAGSLFFIQLFSTFGFSILMSTLVLYATNQLGLSDFIANSIIGGFLAFNFFLHLVGGAMSGQLFSHRGLFILGMISQVIGAYIISLGSVLSLYWGLSFFLAGSGLNVTCLNCMLTQLFEPHDKRRESSFLWNYSGMNIGFMIGFFVSGFFELRAMYNQLFLVAAIGNAVAILVVLVNWPKLKDIHTSYLSKSLKKKTYSVFLTLLIVITLVFLLRWLLIYVTFSNHLVLWVGVCIFFTVAYLGVKQKRENNLSRIFAFLILTMAALIFAVLYQMAPMGLMLFIERNVDRFINGMELAPQWFSNVNTIVIIIGGPLMAFFYKKLRKKGYNISVPLQFFVALLLIGLGYTILNIGIFFASPEGYVNFLWVVLSYIFQSFGELFITPIGYAMIGQLIPKKLQGFMMGVWMMSLGVGAVISSFFSRFALKSLSDNPLISNINFNHTFFTLGLLAIIGALILFFISKRLNKLIAINPKFEETTLPH